MATKTDVSNSIANLKSELSIEIGKTNDRVTALAAGATTPAELDAFVSGVNDAKASLAGQLQAIAPVGPPAPPSNQP